MRRDSIRQLGTLKGSPVAIRPTTETRRFGVRPHPTSNTSTPRSSVARDALMEMTRGEEEAFTQGTVQEILQAVKDNIRKDGEQRSREEAERREAAGQQVSATLRAELEEAKVKAVANGRELASLKAQKIALQTTRRARCARWAGRTMSVVKWLIIFVLVIGTASTFPWKFQPITSAVLRYGLGILQAVLLALVVASLAWGTTVENLLRSSEARIVALLEAMVGAADEADENADQGGGPSAL